jgi:glycogen(starch) synthase
MKIMIFNTLYYPYKIGGAEISVQLLAESMAHDGNDVMVVAIHDKKTILRDNINGVHVIYVPLKNLYWPYNNEKKNKILRFMWHCIDMYNPFMAKIAEKIIKEFNPDIIHTNNLCGFSVAIWGVSKRNGYKVIHTLRDYYLLHPNSTLFNGRNIDPKSITVKLWSYIKRIQSKKVDEVIGISDFILKMHVGNKFFNYSTQKVIFNSVNQILVGEKSDIAQVRVGYIGRLTEEKGFFDFIKIVKNIKKIYNTKIYVAGNVKQLPFDFINDLEIDFLGYTTPEQFLSKVDIVILPLKWNEPFGRTVVEAALANKIVITNKVGAITELMSVFKSIYEIDSFEWDDLPSIFEHELDQSAYMELFLPESVSRKYYTEYLSIAY